LTFAQKYESITFIAYKSDLESKLHCESAAEGSNIDESTPIRAEITGDSLSRAEGIAATRAVPDSQLSSSEAIACFSCGRSFLYTTGNDFGRFCSARCREWFDAGYPAHRPLDTSRLCNLPIGPHGFLISCAGCGIRFDSKGLRCCSTDCEGSLGRKRELDAFLKDDPFRGVKRKCLGCGGDIPNWRNGRRVSAATRFCKPVCQRQTAKKAGLASGDQNPVLSVQTAKKCPPNGPSRKAA
jgi:hypothetical protein